jgi:hypothetical protein
MEDGIEREYFYLKYNTEKPETNTYLYVCIPTENLTDFKITFDKDKAIIFLQEKTHRVEIYKKNKENLYVPSYECLYISN